MVQCDLRQPRTKLATAGDQQVEEAVFAQRLLKFVQLTEKRHNAARHLSLSRLLQGPNPPTLRGRRMLRLSSFGRAAGGDRENIRCSVTRRPRGYALEEGALCGGGLLFGGGARPRSVGEPPHDVDQ